MKSNIPTPVVILIAVALLAVVATFAWMRANSGSGSESADAAKKMTREVNKNPDPGASVLTPEQAHGGATSRGGGGK